jgi:poly-gamma-glutamate synthesis protein (capsule biosynthesis protein)
MSSTHVILTGDVNFMRVTDPKVPFAQIGKTLRAADLVFGNLECMLYTPPPAKSAEREGFIADPEVGGRALTEAGFAAVGVGNNVHYGEDGILSSLKKLDSLGIAHTGAGENLAAARKPAIVERNGVRFGFLQRSSVYWPVQEAAADVVGIATLRANTAYQVPMHKNWKEIPPFNRAGIGPVVVTWAEPRYRDALREDILALRKEVDVVVVSCHWGLKRDILEYMTDVAHMAIDSGADVVFGHGPHYTLPVEAYRGKPIFYGMGNFSFISGHSGRRMANWLGLMAKLDFDGAKLSRAGFSLVRNNDSDETMLKSTASEADAVAKMIKAAAELDTRLTDDGETLWIDLTGGAA